MSIAYILHIVGCLQVKMDAKEALEHQGAGQEFWISSRRRLKEDGSYSTTMVEWYFRISRIFILSYP